MQKASLMAQMVKNLPAMQEIRVQSWVREIPWRRKWQPTPVFLPGESHRQRSLAGYCPCVAESDKTEQPTHTGHAKAFSACYHVNDNLFHCRKRTAYFR